MSTKSRFEFIAQRPVAIIMIVLGIAVFGYVSYTQLTWDLMPEISYPSFTIRTEYPGAAPEEVENSVSRLLEEQLSLIKDLISITSISRPEQSDIVLEFNWDANLDRAAQEIREKLDQVFLDPAVKRPMILRYDPALDPLLRVGVTADIPLIDLRLLVEDEIARELESIPGVAAARVKGGFEKEILIKLDETQLAAWKIRFNDITARLAQENINLAGGNIKEGQTEYIVRTLNEFRNVNEIGDIIIDKKNDVLVRLKDLAAITYSHKERKVITRHGKQESIEVNIYKEADANIVDVSNRVKARLFGTPQQQAFVKNLKARKTPGSAHSPNSNNPILEKQMNDFLVRQLEKSGQNFNYKILSDQAVFIENSINDVKNTAIIGGILAIIILYLFLQHLGPTMIVAVSIPLSLIATFAPLQLFNVSLNIMSLGGLALGVGMLVDNSIVVMESIFRCREEGDGLVQAAIRGVSEVGGAVISSTLTTVAVFFPIVFVEGIAGQIFGDLSLAVVFSLLASLLVSLFFIPMLASREVKKTADFSFKRFAPRFQEHHTAKNYALLPVDTVTNILRLIWNFLVWIVLCLGANLTILLWPLLAIGGLNRKLAAFLRKKSENFPKDKLLWDDFMSLIPFNNFVESMTLSKNLLRKCFGFFYFIFRYLITGFSYAASRIFLTIAGLFVVFFKGAGYLFLALVIPLANAITRLFGKVLDWVNGYYPRILNYCLKNAINVIGVMVILFLISVFIVFPRLSSELIPEVHQGTLYVNLTFPVGTPVEKNDEISQIISEKINRLDGVQSISYYSGATKDEVSQKEVGEHIGKITVVLKETSNIKRMEERLMDNIRQILSAFTDLDYNISRPLLFTMKPPIEVMIKGYNLELLQRINGEVYDRIAAINGLKDVQSSIQPGYPELVVEFDRMKLSHYGMNSFDVATLIKNKIEGYVATRYKEKDKRVDIRVYLKDDQRQRAENIKNLIINPGGGVPITLSSVANVTILTGPNEIRRVDQDRCAVISANISDISLTDGVKKIYGVFDNYSLPPGFTFDVSGQNKEMETSLTSLMLAMALAILLVYIVMAAQFESLLHPFLIMFTIPMAFIGVILSLYLLNIPVGVTVYIGMITLVGVVVNNAIILIDYINTLRRRGVEKLEAIRQAGAVRLRPILMTTGTTILGLLPMALGMGEGAEIRTPMAITVIAGLSSATFLTLVLIPIIYNKFSK